MRLLMNGATTLAAIAAVATCSTLSVQAEPKHAYYKLEKHSATALQMTDDTWTLDFGKNRDLYAIKTQNSGSGRTEIHVLDAESGYKVYKYNINTALYETGAEEVGPDWTLKILANGDLLALKRRNTTSGKTEVHIYTSASEYQKARPSVSTVLPETDDNWAFVLFNNDDIGALKTNTTKSTFTELYILDANSNYEKAASRFVTALHRVSPANWSFAALPNRDLVAIKRADNGGNYDRPNPGATTQVHVLSARSSYKSFRSHGIAPVDTMPSDWSFGALRDGSLFGLKRTHTSTRSTEIYDLIAVDIAADAAISVTSGVAKNASALGNGVAAVGLLDARCIARWDSRFSQHSVRGLAMQTRKRRHCIRLTVHGPIELAAVEKEITRNCFRSAVEKTNGQTVFERLIKFAMDEYGGVANAAAPALDSYVNVLGKRYAACLSGRATLLGDVATTVGNGMSARIKSEARWVYSKP